MERVTGTVKSYDPEAGKGLIVLDGTGEEVLVDLQGSYGVALTDGLRVQFQMIHRPTGVYAVDVTRIGRQTENGNGDR